MRPAGQLTLVERKKRQWATERAEMENLCTPWGLPPPAYGFGRHQTGNRYSSTLEMRDTCPATAQQNLLPRRQRSPSLPPILTGKDQKYGYEDGEGETSGYASDPHSSPDCWKAKETGECGGQVPAWNHRSQEDDQRPRWGDRGIAAGRFWEPHDADARLPQVAGKGTPKWVERSLNMIDNGHTQILVIDQRSNHSSGDTDYKAMSEHHEKNTYLLGQNVPIEPNIKAEREYKRLKALELQAAIVQQLEDREKQKREERERRIREEREEEERFRKQQELERKRIEEERRAADEKQQREQKRAEALRLALEKAEQQAKLEKENKKNRKLRENFDAMSLQSVDTHYDRSLDRSPKTDISQRSAINEDLKKIQNVYADQAYSPARSVTQEKSGKLYGSQGSSENLIMSNSQSARFSCQSDTIDYPYKDGMKKVETPRRNPPESLNTILHSNQSMGMMPDAQMSLVQIPLPQEVFNPMHFANGSGVQMALLVPQASLYPCIHQPMSMHALFSMEHQQRTNIPPHIDTDETASVMDRGGKLLTPSKYRNPNYRDVSTQTDLDGGNQKNADDSLKRRSKFSENELEINLERIASEEKLNSVRKEKRLTPEDRIPVKDLENRPKWGVNKPPTQYKKQSEKDIFYTQKRKLRQRKRIQEKNYTSHSSDDNRSPSPVKISNEKSRVSLSDYHWRKKGMKPDKDIYGGNVTVETTQILPLECDSSGIVHVGENFHNHRRVYTEKKPSASKRGITLTQKFMNDKYGNPKLWHDTEQTVSKSKYEEDPTIKEKLNDRKKYTDNLNSAKREQSNYYNDDEPNQPLILDQLRSLRDSLKKQQQIWGKYENRSPSPKRECDLEME